MHIRVRVRALRTTGLQLHKILIRATSCPLWLYMKQALILLKVENILFWHIDLKNVETFFDACDIIVCYLCSEFFLVFSCFFLKIFGFFRVKIFLFQNKKNTIKSIIRANSIYFEIIMSKNLETKSTYSLKNMFLNNFFKIDHTVLRLY